MPQFLIHSFTDGHLACFQDLANVNCTTMNIGVHRFFWIGVSTFLGYNPSSGIAGSKGSSILSFLRKFHTVFPQWVHQSAFAPTDTRVPFSPQPHQHLLFVDLFVMAILIGVKCYLIVVLLCISLMANYAEHPFIFLWTLCMSSLWSTWSGLLSIFEVDCLSSWSGVMWALHIFWRSNPCPRCHW